MSEEDYTIEVNKKLGSGAYSDWIFSKRFDDLTKHSDKWQHYLGIYAHYYYQLKNHQHCDIKGAQTLVEVGVQKGGSLEMWSKLWPGKIIGIDVDPECAKLEYEVENRTPPKIVIGDQGDPAFWDKFLKENPRIDFFVDDGGHFMDQQILTFEKVFPKLHVGGIYICEDCHTSYMPYNGGGLGNKRSFIEYAKSYVDIIHSGWWSELDTEMERKKQIGKDLTSIHFFDSIVVFEKFGKQEMKRVFPKQFS
jgi:hypothetical protein